ncbi:Vesicular integral-membrane protein VIP36 [Tyrophagus putrescentiae]|nr:Vesicular integral-membrane protein VIP36 [Tyrophagus putrescentiae]
MAYFKLSVNLLTLLLGNFLLFHQNVNCNEYDDIGIYPQIKHSLKKPYSYEWEMVECTVTEWPSGTSSSHYTKGHVYGNSDYFTGLGIFLDTYPNKFHGYHQYPFISALANNGSHNAYSNGYGNSRYYGSAENPENQVSELSGCHAAIRNAVHGRASISIQYYEGLLKVRTDVEQRNRWTLCFASRIHLPAGYYIGLTASTNYLSDNHDILELRTYRLDYPPPTTRDDKTVVIVMPRGGAGPGHWSLSVSVAVLCAAALKILAF